MTRSRFALATLFMMTAALTLGLAPAPAPAAGPGQSFPDSWFYPDRVTGQRHSVPKSLEGRPAPALKLGEWVGDPQDLAKLEGKVVVIDFWATWCGPCMRAMPKNIALVDKYKGKGLAFLGVHDSRRGKERIPQVARQLKINYPLAVDQGGVSTKNYRVAFWPTYVILDHRGTVRAAGIMPHHVEDAVKVLLAEREAAMSNGKDG